jgi:UDP-N-acetyl-D-glucosamine dehydrogenase
MPGEYYLASITNFWRVYAGRTPAAADTCEAFLSQVINAADYPLTRLATTTASETAKVLENSYRATKDRLHRGVGSLRGGSRYRSPRGVGRDRRRPTHNNIRQPGFGIGGYCRTTDPLFVAIAARELFHRDDL